ncbi:hypothetical protein PoB_005485500 [Plakobranchus ocellatus]|uniref:Uncharacterized protein n=1 Tax=Plakobranchus ocellatus TaxID=259542 RepID=A0AAV4CAB2_9GAST|nr:hypothetical protein PoB_005485500 [Plakobranchus ocellatus]
MEIKLNLSVVSSSLPSLLIKINSREHTNGDTHYKVTAAFLVKEPVSLPKPRGQQLTVKQPGLGTATVYCISHSSTVESGLTNWTSQTGLVTRASERTDADLTAR